MVSQRKSPIHIQLRYKLNSVTFHEGFMPFVRSMRPVDPRPSSPAGCSSTRLMCLAQLGHCSTRAKCCQACSSGNSTVNSRRSSGGQSRSRAKTAMIAKRMTTALATRAVIVSGANIRTIPHKAAEFVIKERLLQEALHIEGSLQYADIYRTSYSPGGGPQNGLSL